MSTAPIEEHDLLLLRARLARALESGSVFDETELARWKWFAEHKGTTFEELVLAVLKTESDAVISLQPNAARAEFVGRVRAELKRLQATKLNVGPGA